MIVQSRGKVRALRPATQLAEAMAGIIDPDEHLYSRIGEVSRNLPSLSHEQAIEACFAIYQREPLGKRMTDLTRDFVVGDGITYSCRNPNVEDLIGEWWTDEVNDLEIRLHDFARDLGLFGEWIPEVFVGDVSGIVQLGYIDPGQLKGVDHKAGNPLVLEQIRVKKKGAGQRGHPMEIVRRRNGKLTGEVFYFRVNGVSNSTRGWPDLLHLADWLNAYDQLLWEVLERARLMRTFIWDVELEEQDETKIAEWARKYGTPPRSGTVRVHNQGEKWQAVSPQLGSYETAKEAQVILEHIAGGRGVPKHWLAAAEDVNRATATEMGTPTVRMLAERQRYFVSCIRKLVRFVLEVAEEKGRLRTEEGLVQIHDEDGKPLSDDQGEKVMARPHELVVIQAPEISPKDIASGGNLLVQVSQMLSVAEEHQWFGRQTVRQVLASLLAHIGYDYDPRSEEDEGDETIVPESERDVESWSAVQEAVRRAALAG